MRIAANLTMMFQEAGGLLQRYEMAAAAGFKYVECANPYGESVEALVKVKEKLGLQQVLINGPMGKQEEGAGFGFACIPEKKAEFRDSIELAIRYAKGLNCSRIHVMAGKAPAETLRVVADKVYTENLKFASEKMADDIFHVQQICGSITDTVKRCLRYTSHIQIAQVPHRHEPDSFGEIDYGYVFDLLKRQGYADFIGCEYIPAGKTTEEGLGWIEKYGLSTS